MKSVILPSGHVLTGWHKNPVDDRDYQYSALRKVATPIPHDTKFDVSNLIVRNHDQAQEGSCTGQSGSENYEMYRFKKTGVKLALSPQQLYHDALVVQGSLPEDAGSDARTICKVLAKTGICTEKKWPYSKGYLKTPTKTAYKDAATRKISSYYVLKTVDDILHRLSLGLPFMIGFPVYESFESAMVATTGQMPIPNIHTEQLLGGHEVSGVGINVVPGHVRCLNHWGNWGVNGSDLFDMPIEFLLDPTIGCDMMAFDL